MEKEIKEKWIEVLRSGEYKQGKNYLRTSHDTFCCLGVLCDLIDNTKWQIEDNFYSYQDSKGNYGGSLPNSIRRESDLSGKLEEKLIELNDEEDYDFNQIADYIQENINGE